MVRHDKEKMASLYQAGHYFQPEQAGDQSKRPLLGDMLNEVEVPRAAKFWTGHWRIVRTFMALASACFC